MKLPDDWKRENRVVTIATMPINTQLFIIPWAFERVGDRLELRIPNCSLTPEPLGTSALGITKQKNGELIFDFSHLNGTWEGW